MAVSVPLKVVSPEMELREIERRAEEKKRKRRARTAAWRKQSQKLKQTAVIAVGTYNFPALSLQLSFCLSKSLIP